MVPYDIPDIKVPIAALVTLAFNGFGIFIVDYFAARLAIRHERGSSD
jgi:hypothetical protein